MFIVGVIAAAGPLIFSVADPGRGSSTARSSYINSLGVNRTFEWLFEGGDPSYLDGNSQDPDFSNVTMQLLFNGADASTTIEDESPVNTNLSALDGAQLDTAQFKFGVSSLLLDGVDDQVFQTDASRHELGNSEWTIELWVRFNGDPGAATMPLISKYASGQKSYEISLINNELVGNFTTDGSSDTNMFTETWNPAGDTWYHLAFCRDNSGTDTVRVFVDGTQLGSGNTAVDGNTFFNGTSAFKIGTNGANTLFYNGWMDEYRITTGTARYTTNFTAPIESFGRGARPLIDTGGAILPAFSQAQIGFSSVDSIKFGQGVDEGIRTAASEPNMLTDNYALELWYQQEDYVIPGITQFTGGQNLIQMIGTGNNSTRWLGTNIHEVASASQRTYAWPSTGRIGVSTGWASFVDTYGDDTPHQLMEIREVASRADYIVILDGIPIAAGNGPEAVIDKWDNTSGFEINGRSDVVDNQRPGTQFGSLTFYNNGEEFTLQKVRELFEVSALSGHDMLTVPKWVALDSENVTLEPFLLEQVTMGDVLDSTGIRSGAIPRTGKIYFEQEIINEGDTTTACRVGIRRMITEGDVGDFTSVAQDGEGHHVYVSGNAIFYDRAINTGIEIDSTSGFMVTGSTVMFAIDWDTGKFWMGRNGEWGDNGGDPENGLNEVFTIDRNTNWAAHVWNSGNAGNGVIRLKCKLGAMKYAPPVGFSAWANNYVAEAGVNGVNNRLLELDRKGVQKDREYLFEGVDTTTYRYDSNEHDTKNPLTEGAGAATNRVLGGTQLSYASPDSATWGRSTNDPHVANSLDLSAGDNAHAWELWYRQPDFAQSLSCLIGGTVNTNIVIGKPTGAVNSPACRNNFNGDLRWESEIETYGDNKIHQLMEVHDGAYSANYFVTLDGMPVADGINSGWFFTNIAGNKFNGDVTTSGTGSSGGDFGSYHQYRGGVPLTLYDVRKLFEASALDGHDMLTSPRFFVLDSSSVTITGADAKGITTLGSGSPGGARTGAIPRNGKVYFEVEILTVGNSNANPRFGIRKLAEPNDVGVLPTDLGISYVNDAFSLVDGTTAITGLTPTGLGTVIVGTVFQIAVDWDTGKWWIGKDNTWQGDGGAGDPANGTNSLDAKAPLGDNNWACWVGQYSSGTGQNSILRTASGELNFTPPTGFSAWEDAN